LPLRFLVLLAALVCVSRRAEAHPFALSGVEVWAGDQDLRVEFRLDAPAVLTEVNRSGTPVTLASLRAEQARVYAYVNDHFRMRNGDALCTQQPPGDLLVHETINKVLFQLRYVCSAPLDQLVIESTLFNDQRPPPQVLCTFHYRRALEHYFFTAGVRSAHIAVQELSQVLPSTLGDGQQVGDRVEPPPGAYANSVSAKPVKTGPRLSPHRVGFVPFLGMGIEHILSGLDHLLFVVALVISVRTRRELILIVSSFTVAHSITLVLGTFELLSASPRLVEPLIAATIVYVAVENLLRPNPAARPALTFGFGLIHGLAFSEALRELGLPARQLVAPLLGFNLGVEVGQLAIVLPLLPLVLWLRQPARALAFRNASRVVNGAVALIATGWFIQRIAGW
jgi:hydrogenase/urease accessory protein HupE